MNSELTMKPTSIIKAPLVSEEYFSGVSLMADALLKNGIQKALSAKITHELPHPDWQPQRDSATSVLNPDEVKNYSVKIADAVEKDIDSGFFPVVIGGDCSILIGSMLGLKRRGKVGLFFIDGHADFYEPGISPSGETADMDLGLVTGRGPEVLTNIEDRKPFVEDSQTVLFGFRDEALIKQAGGANVRETNIQCFSLEDTRYYGFNNCLEKGLQKLTQEVESFWIHLDLDVLADSIMPAVDYRMPDGLSSGELVNVLQRLLKTGKAAGLSLAIFNPTLDWDGSLAKHIVELLARSFEYQQVVAATDTQYIKAIQG